MVAKVPPAGITTYKGTPSAGDLGVGLHIKSADSGGSVTSTTDELVVEGSGDTGIQILSGASSEAGIAFGDSGDSNIGLIGYDHANNRFRFKTNDAVQWYLDSSGNWLPAATDHGIYLGVTTATAANLLDDYEEGEWTFTITGSNSGNLGARSGYAKGSYVKIGNLCHVTMRWETDTDNSISGNLYWSLPFTSAAPTDNADAWVAPGFIRDNSFGTNARTGVYYCSEGTAYVYYYFSREEDYNSTIEVADEGDTDGTGEGVITFSYRTA